MQNHAGEVLPKNRQKTKQRPSSDNALFLGYADSAMLNRRVCSCGNDSTILLTSEA